MARITTPSLLTIQDNATLNNSGSLSGAERIDILSGYLSNSGTMIDVKNINAVSGSFNNYGEIPTGIDLNISWNGYLSPSGYSKGQSKGEYQFNTIAIQKGNTLTMGGDPATGKGVWIKAKTITVAGKITADGQGYTPAQNGPGVPTSQNGGAGHGGTGGGPMGGSAYGLARAPVTLGSASTTATGAGAMRINVSEAMTIEQDGLVSANGSKSKYDSSTSGSAGGSIWITAPSLLGNGSIQAKGGDSDYYLGGAGSGGRIAVYADTLSENLRFNVDGGVSPLAPLASPGTLFLNQTDPEQSAVQAAPLSLPTDGLSRSYITVTLKNADGAPVKNQPVQLRILSGAALYVNDVLVLPGTLIQIGSTNAEGSATATLWAKTTGERVIQARTKDIPVIQAVTLKFVPGPVDAARSKISGRQFSGSCR
ncbi:MAG: invasin domain 3-containing protein [Bacteroidales bacterium]